MTAVLPSLEFTMFWGRQDSYGWALAGRAFRPTATQAGAPFGDEMTWLDDDVAARLDVTAWELEPRGELAQLRQRRLDSLLTLPELRPTGDRAVIL